MLPGMIIDHISAVPLYRQIVNGIIRQIDEKKLEKGDKLPTINHLQQQLQVGRVTVVNAYSELKELGYVGSRQGKSYYIKSIVSQSQKRVFLLFDAMNGYKEVLYRNLLQSLGGHYYTDIFFHYYNLKQFRRFIQNNVPDYDHYVVIPHFNEDVSDILEILPREKLLLLDADVPALKSDYAAVYQPFDKDVVQCLSSGMYLISKYRAINLVLQKGFQFIPEGIINGFTQFCRTHQIKYRVIDNLNFRNIVKEELYLVISDKDLIMIVKYAMENGLSLGKDLGLISYDDTPLKSVLANGITVISTDFAHMGKMAAKILKHGIMNKFENPAQLIIRSSL